MVVFSCKTCDHSISQAFNGAAARGEAHLARTPDPFEASRAKTIGSTTNIAIGEAHLALFVMWCPGGARSMFRTVSEIRAHRGRCFIVTNTPASTNDAGARSKRRQEALVANAKDFSDFWGLPVDLLEEHCVECICVPIRWVTADLLEGWSRLASWGGHCSRGDGQWPRGVLAGIKGQGTSRLITPAAVAVKGAARPSPREKAGFRFFPGGRELPSAAAGSTLGDPTT